MNADFKKNHVTHKYTLVYNLKDNHDYAFFVDVQLPFDVNRGENIVHKAVMDCAI